MKFQDSTSGNFHNHIGVYSRKARNLRISKNFCWKAMPSKHDSSNGLMQSSASIKRHAQEIKHLPTLRDDLNFSRLRASSHQRYLHVDPSYDKPTHKVCGHKKQSLQVAHPVNALHEKRTVPTLTSVQSGQTKDPLDRLHLELLWSPKQTSMAVIDKQEDNNKRVNLDSSLIKITDFGEVNFQLIVTTTTKAEKATINTLCIDLSK
ncbi:hypothetical protein BJ085DRAFT_35537 [Dimargaris cristalligena]|uniref:Uncharacterized protein n=1 Tax=Dimargaris cristalligena TaxID=215637 RepID=A0A4P9ZM94_9FUNG|nr:hypothetical protein BJ085DRAFT_35537 [Dimargaris cristalligena]|eukprot:RKP34454.1 hypothetical protein BJ085DRAFT_35537 [Dimargaris cristalligena]